MAKNNIQFQREGIPGRLRENGYIESLNLTGKWKNLVMRNEKFSVKALPAQERNLF